MAKRTKRRNTRRGVSKKNNKTRKRKTRRTNRKMRGGSGRRNPFERRRMNRVAAGLNPDGPDPRIVKQVRLQESEQTENPLAFNILNKFFKEVDGWFGRKSYELNPTKFGPNNKMNVISAHGISVPEKFIVVPDGLILYLPVAAGDVVTMRAVGSDPNKLNYIRGYKGGSLIQDYLIYFYPLYRNHDIFTTRGLIKLDLPHLSVKNATEANAKLIDFLTRQLKIAFGDQLADRIDKEKSGNIRVHLEEYAPIYFENNIDDIINKNDLIESATEQKQYYLSDILRLIARKRKGNSSISGEWFGTFCRSGEFIDINTFKRCQNIGLPPLPEGFFQGNFHYEGVDLVRQESLASSDPTINFKKILNEVFEKREQYDDNGWKKSFKERIEGIKKSVDNNEVILRKDVCFVFQMKQKYP